MKISNGLIYALVSCVFYANCAEDFERHSNKRLRAIESQESTDQTIITCENDKNCLDIIADSVCDLKEKVCMCGANKCMMDSKIPRHHHKCNTSADCLMEHTVCDSEKCVCDQMYTYSSDKKKCIKLAESGNEDSCEEDKQCSDKNPLTVCRNKSCICKENYHKDSTGYCKPDAYLGQSCSSDGDCSNVNNSKCSDSKKCICLDGYLANGNDSCIEIAQGIDSACLINAQCTKALGDHSLCKNYVCECKDLYRLKKGANKCVRDVLLGRECQFHEDCHQPGDETQPGAPVKEQRMECVLGECQCKPPYKAEEGFCVSGAPRFYFPLGTLLAAIFVVVKMI